MVEKKLKKAEPVVIKMVPAAKDAEAERLAMSRQIHDLNKRLLLDENAQKREAALQAQVNELRGQVRDQWHDERTIADLRKQLDESYKARLRLQERVDNLVAAACEDKEPEEPEDEEDDDREPAEVWRDIAGHLARWAERRLGCSRR